MRREPFAARRFRKILDAVDHHELLVVVEVAGIAGMHPAVSHIGGGCLRALVVAEEHVGVAHHNLADAVDVRAIDADFDVVGHRYPCGVGIDLTKPMQGVDAEQFGLAV